MKSIALIAGLLFGSIFCSAQPQYNPDRLSLSVSPYALWGNVAVKTETLNGGTSTNGSTDFDTNFGLNVALKFPVQRQVTLSAFVVWESLSYGSSGNIVSWSQSVIRAGGTFTVYFDY